MTREEAGKIFPIIKSYSEGKQIEFYNPCEGGWVLIEDPDFSYSANSYRIKKEPAYRPFKDANECWEEMKRHEPFGWFRLPNGYLYSILHLTEGGVVLDDMFYCYSSAFKEFVFTDGTPFGAKEED